MNNEQRKHKVEEFLAEIAHVSRKHGLSIRHEDGKVVIGEYKGINLSLEDVLVDTWSGDVKPAPPEPDLYRVYLFSRGGSAHAVVNPEKCSTAEAAAWLIGMEQGKGDALLTRGEVELAVSAALGTNEHSAIEAKVWAEVDRRFTSESQVSIRRAPEGTSGAVKAAIIAVATVLFKDTAHARKVEGT